MIAALTAIEALSAPTATRVLLMGEQAKRLNTQSQHDHLSRAGNQEAHSKTGPVTHSGGPR